MFDRRLARRVVPVLLFLCLAPLPPPARAAFEIRSHAVHVDAADRQTTFTLTFNQRPDFLGTDSFGNPNNAFQYFFDTNPAHADGVYSGETVSIIRGPEIRFHDNIPIRDSLNPAGQDLPHAEGWGPERGAVDFLLDDDTVTFTVPWEMLHERDAKFSYIVQAYEQGSLTSEASSPPLVIALPPPAWSASAGLVGLPLAWKLTSAWRGRRGG
jgi:hypothetical protein